MHEINYSHKYFKLDIKKHTTVRSANYCEKLGIAIGDTITETLNRKPYCISILTDVRVEKIENMTLEFLKKDAEYDGFTLENIQQFVDLLNSFVPKYNPNKLTTKKAIFFLEVEKWV
ncbi:MAG: hypothetical protein GY870_16415 [archaeon]|nr:hypothetical protein [archaeon]